jgi:competence protein ComEA
VIQLERKQQLVLLVVVGVLLFAGGVKYAQVKGRAAEADKPVLQKSGENEKREILVHVAGAVARPGVYRLPRGSRVADAVEKAGPTAEAHMDAINLAAALTDGQKVIVPAKEAASPAGMGSAGTDAGRSNPFAVPAGGSSAGGKTATAALVNINTADAAQLDTLPGIGPALAQRIIQYRETNGPFQSIEDIKNVSGIGDKKYEALKDLISAY